MGQFVISIDFEKYWGMRDHKSINDYKKNLENVDFICESLLEVFIKYEIHCTWAFVGLLMHENKEAVLNEIPRKTPSYKNETMSPYSYIRTNKLIEKFHLAPNIIRMIILSKNQELASHTYSHYYCLEEGQTEEEFKLDIEKHLELTRNRYEIDLKSLVLPRNQVNDKYLDVIKKLGIKYFRGNEVNWIYKSNISTLLKRFFRLIDSYINISGYNTYKVDDIKMNFPYNIPSSRFLRPVSEKNSIFKGLKLRRIKTQMTNAAKRDELFHLWWHPHNFGNDVKGNLLFLEEILKHFLVLKEKYNMKSLNMSEFDG